MPHKQLPPALWRKSSYSGEQGACVEVADFDDFVGVRDSKSPASPALVVSRSAMAGLAVRIRAGALDL